MKIALDATPLTLSSGGLPRYVSELTRALIARYPEDTFLLSSDQPFATEFPRLPEPRNWLERRWWLYGAEQVNSRAGIDVYHGANFAIPYFARRPTVITVHDLSPWLDPRWHVGAARVRERSPRMIRVATMVITPSESVRGEVIEHFQIPPDRVVATPLAAAAHFQPVPGKPERPYCLFVGTLEPRKNIPMLMEAWRTVRPFLDIGLVIVGRRRSDFAPIHEEPGLQLAGEVPESALPVFYSQATAVIYPSHYEGFGLPVLEAMQCGAPVVISRAAALRELSGGAALEASDAPELASILTSIAANPDFRASLRERSLARARQYSWRRTAELTYNVYREAILRFGR